MSSPALNASIHSRIDVAEGLMILRVLPDGEPLRFSPGQYTVIGLPDESGKWIRRAYSIASSNQPGELLEFFVSLVSEGALTPRLFQLRPGDRIFVSPKATGLFTLDRLATEKDVLLIATGTGLAPYMSMIRSQMACGARQRFIVLHGARYSWELGYRGILEQLARDCKNFFYLPSITRPKDDPHWNGWTGYLQEILFSGKVEEKTGITLSPDRVDVFLCGNPDMIQAASLKLEGIGYQKDRGKTSGTLHIEEYW